MNKKFIISLGLVAAISVSTVAAMAESTIYTDGIGRMHFLGRDAANNKASHTNYANSAEQDLTRKLYDEMSGGVVNDTSYDQHPVKNYENTFPDSRFGVAKFWKVKEASEEDRKPVKATATATKGDSYYAINNYGPIVNTTSSIPANETKTTAKKKHWWNKK